MDSDQPTRRHLLRGFLAGLLSFGLAGTARALSPAAPILSTAPKPTPMGGVTTYVYEVNDPASEILREVFTYDAQGRLIQHEIYPRDPDHCESTTTYETNTDAA
jgi:YD repeat-containing protein